MPNRPLPSCPARALRLCALPVVLFLAACGGGGSSTPAPLAAPTITTPPASASVTVGSPATFTVAATGNPAPTYAWTQVGGSVVGTAATYTIAATTGAMNGQSYTVTVTNSQGTVTSPAATLSVNPSADQAVNEAFGLAPNAIYNLVWNLPVSGLPVAGTDYLAASSHSMAHSPLYDGPQMSNSSVLVDLSAGLATLAATPVPDRFLIDNAIVVASNPAWVRKITYPGTGIQADLYALDGTTLVESFMVSNLSSVSLSGTIATVNASTAASAYPDLTNWYDEIFFNPAILKGTTSWLDGAKYRKYTQTQHGDVYIVYDYSVTQSNSGTTPLPLATGTTVAAWMTAHPSGVLSAVDGIRYPMSSLTATTVGTTPTYVAKAVRPNHSTPCYYCLYEINGNVYIGQMVKDGAVIGGNPHHVGTPASNTVDYSLTYQISLNAEAVDSLKAALAF